MSATLLSRRRPLAIALIVAVAVLLAAWAAYRLLRPHAGPAPVPPVMVSTATARAEDVDIGLTGVGTVQAMATVTVKARIDGQLESVGFVEGQDVKAGQVLARIDPRTFQAALQQAQATKARDEAQLVNARLDLQRFEDLIRSDSTTRQTVDTQRALVNQLAATVRNDEAQIALAQVQLDFTTITAPLSGRVGARLIDPGNIVHATDTTGLVVIRQIDPIDVVFTLPDDAFGNIHRAMDASATPLAVFANERGSDIALGQGKLILLNNTIDTTSGTIQLKARFANPRHTLWPGQYVNARLVLGRRDHAVVVPASAIQRNDAGTYVYVVQADQTVRMQPVQVAELQGARAVMAGGVAAGDRVVADGQYKLKPGVRIAETPASAPAVATAGAARSSGAHP
ncbi:efflux RND transporter periplasmic adaptor subunit [Cupriavidus pauculus]|uniref:efflux RND transporter periplasmic adaptor subunit n=1 Tax=Cupriavidus pauculus TaxID=82633 RepID=UPI001EE36438|nr:efflux RND transporter periplasmic adaptor subunit [Cupriavidus pauculus]GJG93717.1 efflux RND transporter periplasmic adaptor subunit [Cupriavidus pauculus]